MESLFRSPIRVYLALLVLSLIGIWSASRLPVSLFPNSSKPFGNLCVEYSLSPAAFLRSYGESIEEQIRSIHSPDLEVESVKASYYSKRVCFEVEFKWGGSDLEAQRELQVLVASLQGRLPADSRDRVWSYSGRDSGGFLVFSFLSSERSLNELYKILEPVLMPKLAQVRDAQEPWLSNPQKRQLLVELKPEQMATFQLYPVDISSAILRALEGYSGGTLTVTTSSSRLAIDFPRLVTDLDSLKQIQIPTSSGRSVSLSEVARLDLTIPLDSARVIKTNGAPSVILWVAPKSGGNVKQMAQDIRRVVDETLPSLPHDIQYKSLVDPSEFIESAVHNVGREVAVAAGLAVFILFLFVGNLKNVFTAAIEIPLSLVLAFILMRLSGMNLNLVSLGGLALSAGMNVDASVVVMENIFRHFDSHAATPGAKPLDFEGRLQLIIKAVKEVQFAVIASTIASLVVFIPLAFTSGLSYAILGDLAKAVVFSHGFSAIVALVLVPTIRLHLMKNATPHDKPSILEPTLQWLERSYGRALGQLLERPKLKLLVFVAPIILVVVLVSFVIPTLPREVIGKPDTDSIMFGFSTNGNSLIRQMESQAEQVENEILQTFGDKIQFTFTQIGSPNSANILLRLKNKSMMAEMQKALEEKFQNSPMTQYWVSTWNPAELPLPNPPDFKISIRGNSREAIRDAARDIENEIQEKKIFTRTSVDPGTSKSDNLFIRPRLEQWPLLAEQGIHMSLSSLADLTRTATDGSNVSLIDFQDEKMNIFMKYPDNFVSSPEDLGALPVGVGGKILPLKALAQITQEPGLPAIRRENGREAYILSATGAKGEEALLKDKVKKANEVVEKWQESMAAKSDKRAVGSVSSKGKPAPEPTTTIQVEDAQKELNEALQQLGVAVSLSIALIFLTMVFQFGSIMNSLLVLVAIPLGFIGVVISLFAFKSTLSLNSLLGVILLNGLAVANSIILVDFLQRKVREGVAPRLAAVEVARVRLRPILMTSMTTGLGMLPVAFGFGEGGKILQPLGIAVAGGLCFSMVTTLFIVPALQVSWLEWSAQRTARRELKP